MNKPLRFAPFIRVSTEKQAEHGRSLQDQKAAIIGYVKTLGGTIPETCWQYVGQESATPDTEKRMFNRLLQDAEKGAFNCVIVQHADRLSRDNEQLKKALRIFRTTGIRFFVQTTEKDLYNPQDCFELGLTAEFSEFVALQYAKKSIVARIASAKEQADAGIAPKNLRLPYARIRRPDCTWGLDENKAEQVRTAVALFLDAENGKGVEPIAKIIGINYATLNRCFRFTLGDTWSREFKSKKFNFSESVKYTIPAIIEDPETIQAVYDRMQKNKTFTHANRKRNYLLSKFVLCGECGSSFSGACYNSNNKTFYVHVGKKRSQCVHSKPPIHINADLLESVVMAQLEDMFSSPEAIEQKVKEHCAGTPVNEKNKTLTLLENEQRQLKAEIQRLMDGYAKGLFSDEELQPLIQEKRTRAVPLAVEIEKLHQELSNTPSEKEIRQAAQTVSKAVRRAIAHKRMVDMVEGKYRDDRKLIESVFDGRDSEGKRLGVYVRKENGKWIYELRGNLPWVNKHGELADDSSDTDNSGNSGENGPSSDSAKYKTAQRAYISWLFQAGVAEQILDRADVVIGLFLPSQSKTVAERTNDEPAPSGPSDISSPRHHQEKPHNSNRPGLADEDRLPS
ncbi:MAG: hypothetical protein EHM79_05465 [Geobacter sp.]|nr:MAG: hypothetical protein EHM79_05465 [Geobacter sp.]